MSELGDRTTYLGATDLAAIVGLSPYAAPIDVWQEKVNGIRSAETDAMRAGSVLEDAILQLYQDATGRQTFKPKEKAHPAHPFLRFHPDALTYHEPRVVDAKGSWYGQSGYGEAGTDDVPVHVRIQMVCYLGVTGRDVADIPLFRRPPIELYHVLPDPELYERLVEEGVRFWTDHVLTKTPPEPDGSEAHRAFVASRYAHDVEREIVATPEQALLMEELADLGRDRIAITKREDLLKNRLAEQMGDATVLLGSAGKCTFRPTVSPRWSAIAKQIAADHGVEVEPYAAADMEGRAEPSFRFYPSRKAEEEKAA